MIYLICAFKSEAAALVQRLNLQRRPLFSRPGYLGETAVLIVSGMGMEAAESAVEELFRWRRPDPDDLLVNVGICAAPGEYPVGTLLYAETVRCRCETFRCAPLPSDVPPAVTLQTFDTAQSTPGRTPADMEAFGILKAASRFLPRERLRVFKTVSDHFEPQAVTKSAAQALIGRNADSILFQIEALSKKSS